MAAITKKRSVRLDCIPSDFSLSYLSEDTLTLKSKQQGFKYFNEGYFHNVGLFMCDENGISVAAKCYRSQRKSEKPHSIHFDIGMERITFAHCSCQAGACGSCSHIVGLVQALCQWQLMGFTTIPTDLSCTSLPQQWNRPRGPKIEGEPVPSITFVNPKPDRKKIPIQNKLVDCRKINVQPQDVSLLQSLNGCGLGYLISRPSKTVDTHVGTVPIGCGLATHAKFFNTTTPPPVSTNCGDVKFPKEGLVDFLCLNMPVMEMEKCVLIEESTREQSDNPMWYEERRKRITASQFGQVLKRKTVTEKFISSLRNPKSFTSVQTSYGKVNEQKGVNLYRQRQGLHTHKSGLIVNPKYPFLGASPDGKVCDNGVCGLIEVKCPYTARDMTIAEACELRDFCLQELADGTKLRKTHNYYYQVQGQLLVSGADFCDFVVYTRKDLHIERICFDKGFCETLVKDLYSFYMKYLN